MRYLRGLAAAAVVAGAAGLCIWAGHIGSTGWWRGIATLAVGLVAWVVVSFVPALVALDGGEEAGCALAVPALALVWALIWLTTVDVEIHSEQWQAVAVMDKDCQSSDSGCAWRYRVSDLRTERDLGWIYCDDKGLDPGDHTRVRADPSGRHRPSLEPCAHTSHGWTIALRVVQGLWVVAMLAAFGMAVFGYDDF
ncbi:hypothetical protein ACPPVO_17085 [Dactylosporangium sp. McL0621]|uniref:hypothetical protein n=1 Tax=Dactylosporangium sp. McL0621 TaxID=3415678 RepID=UPI003CE8F2A8